MNTIKFVCFLSLFIAACNNNNQNTMNNDTDSPFAKGSYGYDAAFVKKYAKHVLELEDGNAKVLLCADYQGRVFTSSASGDTGTSYGWLNYSLLSSGEKKK